MTQPSSTDGAAPFAASTPESPARKLARPSSIACWVLVVQCLLALSWTMYVVFLPGLLVSAGIARAWFPAVLVADQAIFAITDWYAGVYADRVAHLWTRLGRIVTAATLVSSAALLTMPWIADGGNGPLLIGLIVVWAATSSALRAPVFALLGRVREEGHDPHRTRAGAVSLALVGIGLAGALGPYVTLFLKGIQPHLPMAVSAITLAIAGLWALRVERVLPLIRKPDGQDAASTLIKRRAWALALVTFVATFGTQMVTAVVARPILARYVGGDEFLWGTCFWLGFTIGLVPGARAAAHRFSLAAATAALLTASVVILVGTASARIVVLGASLVLAGAAWSVFTTIIFSTAVSLSDGRASTRGAGTATGMLFSAIAACTLVRLLFVAAGGPAHPTVVWLPEAAWIAASLLLVAAARALWRPPAIAAR